MQTITPSDKTQERRRRFFSLLFGDNEGYICLAERIPPTTWREAFFKYPVELDAMLDWINFHINGRDLYFCSQLLREKRRVAVNVQTCPNLWADLDEVDPNTIEDFPPTVSVQTSPGRWHGYWVLDKPLSPVIAEDLNRRLSYHLGADKSGWDLSQVLRIPVSYNMKYPGSDIIVDIDNWKPKRIWTKEKLDTLPVVKGAPKLKVKPAPIEALTDADPEAIIKKYEGQLHAAVYDLFSNEVIGDRSSALWRLEKVLIESKVSLEDAFVIAWNSKVNKYKIDNRTPEELWHELLKAQAEIESDKAAESAPEVRIPSLITPEELASLPDTFVDRYVAWNRTRTDAAWQYHQISAMVLLSAILADSVHLPTRYGKIIPNIWAMILGDTTLTRKTTAMDIAIELLMLVYDEAYLASDASIEGLLSAVATRPNKTSVFVRDEFAGMLESMKRREYQAGMMEALTKLYDGKYQKRQLRKEVIEVRDPVFIMFCGGIRSRIMELFDARDIESGFIPRFIFVSAEPDMDAFQPLGPPTKHLREINTEFVEELLKMKSAYDSEIQMRIGSQMIMTKGSYPAELTPEAWDRYAKFERALVEAGKNSDRPDAYTPAFDRLAKSGIKCAVLLAAARQTPTEGGVISVELVDVLQGIKYIDQWKQYTIEVLTNSGKTMSEKTIERAYGLMKRGKHTRAAVMISLHINSRETDLLLDTMEQRGLIVRSRNGKQERITVI